MIIKFASKEIPKSPFKVSVEGAAGDASKVTAKGPGIEKTGVVATKKTYFEVYTKGETNLAFLYTLGPIKERVQSVVTFYAWCRHCITSSWSLQADESYGKLPKPIW